MAGILLVYKKKIDLSTVVGLSSLVNHLFLPCLLFVKLGYLLSTKVLEHSYAVIVISSVASLLTFLLSNTLLCYLAQPTKQFRPWFNIGLVVPNMFSLMKLFIDTVCQDFDFHAPPFDLPDLRNEVHHGNSSSTHLNVDECEEYFEMYNFLYALPITMALFTLGPKYITSFRSQEIPPILEVIKKTEIHPDSIAVNDKAGSEIGIEDNNEFRDEEEKKDPVVGSPRLPSIYESLFRFPTSLAIPLGLFVGLISPLQDFFFDTESTFKFIGAGLTVLGRGVVPGLNTVMACTFALKVFSLDNKWDIFGNEKVLGISSKTLAVYTFSRMVIVPLITLGLLTAIYGTPAVPDQNSLKFMVNLVVIMPTSPVVLMFAHITGDSENAGILAIVGFFQFLFGLFSLTSLLILSLSTLNLL